VSLDTLLHRSFGALAYPIVALTHDAEADELHQQRSRLNEFRDFSPDPEIRPANYLGDRKFVYFDDNEILYPREPKTYIVMGENVAQCQIYGARRASLQTTVLFEPGTAEMVGYVGKGRCLTEPPFDDAADRSRELVCADHHESPVIVSGYAWPFEGSTEDVRTSLSERRIQTVKRRLKSSAFTSDVVQTAAHGSSRTNAPVDEKAPVPGVSLTTVSSEAGSSGLVYLQRRGETWSDAEFDRIRDLIEALPDPDPSYHFGRVGIDHSTSTYRYRGESGDTVSLTPRAGFEEDRAIAAIDRWVSALIDNGCDFSKTRRLEHYLRDAL
jgi:hypothetical protein